MYSVETVHTQKEECEIFRTEIVSSNERFGTYRLKMDWEKTQRWRHMTGSSFAEIVKLDGPHLDTGSVYRDG